ncbi:MAG: hypothetical protein Q7S58_13805 [Candidatus Binatus sp.]|uniref:hypothetical protein n=1 Tax=Candidatus Binatus sp. TaxID=2811406 RepID=UPI00271E9B7F|nr:hypothetical protein [Candidatus Binatus sp.]MDO8433474.1 hypothetical protein [Candidatus Binatus sp.]
MEAYGQSILIFVAPLVVVYVALLGIGYLIADEKEWRERNRAPQVRSLPVSKAARLAETERPPLLLPSGPIYRDKRLTQRLISKPLPRRPGPTSHR